MNPIDTLPSTDTLELLLNTLKEDPVGWKTTRTLFVSREIPARTTLLREGEIAANFYFIKKGCLRMWFNKDGRDITFQFFFEGQGVASIESLTSCKPGRFFIESIEPTEIVAISRADMEQLLTCYPRLKEGFIRLIFQRFGIYAELFLSRICHSPEERYRELLANRPDIIRRVPQHYIASYLGITPVSLSRIRNRIQ